MSDRTISADEAYGATQKTVEIVSRLLLHELDEPLDSLIARAERSMAIGPILHPSEFRDGAEKLSEVLTCAYALRGAREEIRKAACPS